MSETVANEKCTFIFKKRKVKNQANRNRKSADSEEETSDPEDQQTVIKKNKRNIKVNPNIQCTKKLEKKKLDKVIDSSSDNEDFRVSYKSNKSAMPNGPTDQGATATVEIDTQKDRDAQALFEKRIEINKELEGKEDDKVYRGLNNYAQYYKPKDTVAGNASSGMVRKGPMRAPANLRTTVRWDYQPDICKDYKETGFCGFGDSCKFLHDRSDYKHGWQLEREWDEGKYNEGSDDDTKYEVNTEEEDLPFKCVICRQRFVDPVVTKCKHYFCEKCVLERGKKTTRCFVCNSPATIFKPANNLIAKLKHINQTDSDSDAQPEDQ